MENGLPDSKLLITFPKSSEDHRLQLVKINDAIFAIVYAPLESFGPINLHCEDWSLILLAPLKSKSNVLVSAINIIALSEITSAESINLHATNQLVKFAKLDHPPEKTTEMGIGGEYLFGDDPGALLYFHQLFEGIVSSIHKESPDLHTKAPQEFIKALCVLADKIKGMPGNLDIQKVLDIWKITR